MSWCLPTSNTRDSRLSITHGTKLQLDSPYLPSLPKRLSLARDVNSPPSAMKYSYPPEDEALIDSDVAPPTPASFAHARRLKLGGSRPQAIAHRGYKAKFPENSLAAFQGALDVGAQAIETDMHLSKDGVVVLSHDATLKRCYGRNEKIIDCDWATLSTLRTLAPPHVPMARFSDLLRLLAAPGNEEVWVLLDIKLDNDADDLMRLIAETIESVPPSRRPWSSRIVLGCWVAKYLPLCHLYLPKFPITHIGFSLAYARQFLKVPNVSFNLLKEVLVGPAGTAFLHDARAAGRPVFVWTVNTEAMMRWSIRKGVDGVITDDPKRYLELSDDYNEHASPERLPMLAIANAIRINFFVVIFSILLRCKYGFGVDPRWTRITIPARA